jgi:hypothetical protein
MRPSIAWPEMSRSSRLRLEKFGSRVVAKPRLRRSFAPPRRGQRGPNLALSPFVIGHHDIQLAASSVLRQFESMKTQKLIQSDSNRRLLAMAVVICSMAFAGCSDVAATEGNHHAVNLQSAVVGHAQTGDYVTIGPSTYNPATRSFDRPWPFGPESSAQ